MYCIAVLCVGVLFVSSAGFTLGTAVKYSTLSEVNTVVRAKMVFTNAKEYGKVSEVRVLISNELEKTNVTLAIATLTTIWLLVIICLSLFNIALLSTFEDNTLILED